MPDAHHLATPNDYAFNGNCTQCHDSSSAQAAQSNGGNPADHSGLVADYANCTTCHSANVGVAQGAVVNSGDPTIHDACVDCHNNDGTLRLVGEVVNPSLVVAMPNPSGLPDDGGGTCAACHGTDGKSPGAIPAINGKSAGFIVESLKEFRSGVRPSTVMGRHATGYSDEEIQLIADFFSKQ